MPCDFLLSRLREKYLYLSSETDLPFGRIFAESMPGGFRGCPCGPVGQFIRFSWPSFNAKVSFISDLMKM